MINAIPVIFPALIIRLVSHADSIINPFEFGALAFPFLAANVFLFGIGFLYKKNNLPTSFLKLIEFIRDFDISPRIAAIIILVLLSVFVGFTFSQLFIDESTQYPDYTDLTVPALRIWLTGNSSPSVDVMEEAHRYVEMTLLTVSQNVFHNIKVLPYLGSISLLILTYLTAVKISKKRFSGIISMVILLQSYTFLKYATISTYPNFWILFYVLSIYLLYNKWFLSAFSYGLSIFSKILTAPFFLMTIFFIFNSSIAKDKRLSIIISYVVVAIISIVIILILQGTFYTNYVKQANPSLLWYGMVMWANQMRFDTFIVLTILPVVVGLFFTAKRGIPEANSILIMLAGMFLEEPVLQIVNPALMEPYRFITLAVFFAIGVGVIFSKRTK